MTLYHELSTDSLTSAQKYGLKCDTSGAKTDKIIDATDKILDANRPAHIQKAGISRQHNLYAFIGTADFITDIKTGKRISLQDYQKACKGTLLRLTADPAICFVSDLDRYDAIKSFVAQNQPPPSYLLTGYWESLVPLANYTPGNIARPEVMITRDIPPHNIHVVKNLKHATI